MCFAGRSLDETLEDVDEDSPLQRGVSSLSNRVRSGSLARRASSGHYDPPCKDARGHAAATGPTSSLNGSQGVLLNKDQHL